MPTHHLHTSTNLLSSQDDENSRHESPEAERERRATAALTRLQNRAANPDQEASSLATPSQQPAVMPPVLLASESREGGSSDNSESTGLQLVGAAASQRSESPSNLASMPQVSRSANSSPEVSNNDGYDLYSAEERQQDDHVDGSYRDIFTRDLILDDPVRFNGRLYE